MKIPTVQHFFKQYCTFSSYKRRMHFKITLLERLRIKAQKMSFVLLWYLLQFLLVANCKCQNISFCIESNNNRGECQLQLLHGINHTLYFLSNITRMAKDCKTVQIYLTSGVHHLTTDLTFTNVKETFIQGQGIYTENVGTTIGCRNAGIIFSDNNSTVEISNISFRNCKQKRNLTWRGNKTINDILITLYFKNSSFSLDNVEVANTNGIGLYALNCEEHIINHSIFHNNSLGNLRIILTKNRHYRDTVVSILNTTISDGNTSAKFKDGGGLQVRIHSYILYSLSIVDSKFQNNEGQKGSHLLVEAGRKFTSVDVNITNSIFSQAKGCNTFGTIIESLVKKFDSMKIMIENSEFTESSCGALAVNATASYLRLYNCSFGNNRGIGLYNFATNYTEIINTTFHNNSKALHLVLYRNNIEVLISYSQFINNKLFSNGHSAAVEVLYRNRYPFDGNIRFERSSFEKNHGNENNCSTLHLSGLTVTLSDINICDNNCSGIALMSSNVKIKNTVTIARNSAIVGGGIRMESGINKSGIKELSSLTLDTNGILKIIRNNAMTYGGGIFTDENCENRNNKECPIQLMEVQKNFTQIRFEGNHAAIGGDSISQGCFSDCNIENYNVSSIDYCNEDQLFWKIVSTEVENKSLSTFAEYPKKVVFCDNVVSCERNHINCTREHQKEAHPGQVFEVWLMVADDNCIPSVGVIEATARLDGNNTIYIGSPNATEILRKSKKHCSPYQFTAIGKAPGNFIVIQLSFQRESKFYSPPAILNVTLLECRFGFKYVENQGQCGCLDVLKSVHVECISANHSLKVPHHTWIGNFQGSIVANKYCQHCKEAVYTFKSDSDILCKKIRSGTLCSSCAANNSLLLGKEQCSKCSSTNYKGIVIVVSSVFTGILLVITLLTLNITVSTGTINALIFYSNIVYSCHEIFLPVNTNTSGRSYDAMLKHLVQILFTFQAWVNLNFGISTCFFDGYNTYVSVWMQFLFPLYIWLLILLIVLASRYSSRISRLTTSNTVPVLATLLLLSYSKLLETSITAISFTSLNSLNGSSNYTVWMSDGSIIYLHGKHIPIFIVSIICLIGFILPFTLLILLGPKLQAKSHYRTLKWINKLKPLMDAFYGPYTDTYRYWPGILLMARLILFFTFALYSLGDTIYKLALILVMVTVLLIVWICLSKTHSRLPYQRKSLNYLELFFNLNLAIFTISSVYFEKIKRKSLHQQILASVMVGTVFLVFSFIIGYHILQTMLKFRRCIQSIHTRRFSNDDANIVQYDSEKTCSTPSKSIIDMKDIASKSVQIREPLLDD